MVTAGELEVMLLMLRFWPPVLQTFRTAVADAPAHAASAIGPGRVSPGPFTTHFFDGMPFAMTSRSLTPLSRFGGVSNRVETIWLLPTASTPIRLWSCVRA